MKKILNKCPICGGKLELASLWQFTKYYEINSKGIVNKSVKHKGTEGSMDASFLTCVNKDFVTDCDLDIVVPSNTEFEVYVDNDGVYYIEQ